jgi:hypothetical protein
MPTNIEKTLRVALVGLKAEKDRIDGQIRAIEGVINVRQRSNRGAKETKKGMSVTTREAISQRMRAYWAKRKKTARKKAG